MVCHVLFDLSEIAYVTGPPNIYQSVFQACAWLPHPHGETVTGPIAAN